VSSNTPVISVFLRVVRHYDLLGQSPRIPMSIWEALCGTTDLKLVVRSSR